MQERRLSCSARSCLPLSLSLLEPEVFLPIVAGKSRTCAGKSRGGAREAEKGWIEFEDMVREAESEVLVEEGNDGDVGGEGLGGGLAV